MLTLPCNDIIYDVHKLCLHAERAAMDQSGVLLAICQWDHQRHLEHVTTSSQEQ